MDDSNSGLISPSSDSGGWGGLFQSLIGAGAASYQAAVKSNAATSASNDNVTIAKLKAAVTSSTGQMVMLGIAGLLGVVLIVSIFRRRSAA